MSDMSDDVNTADDEFDDLDGLVPDQLQDDTYLCEITKAEIVTSKKAGNKRWFILNWQIIEPEIFSGWEPLADVYRVATRGEFEAADIKEKQDITKARRKRNERLMQIGVPREELNRIGGTLDNLIGIRAYLTVQVRPKNDGSGDNIWINTVKLASAVDETSLLDVSNY